ncbi:stonustoxin subunit beta-like [Conger conger]|uniref:stonustoxin subunit beta-like n=1 Tax=Conger conger TaxID=82655 RepID=UPI002A5A478C|nr:stonustoxin subunit beta-like [Conger conger]XP_061089125.1 stonustoxin subunit beta-like [Conger conger]XP_061089127.1 stonustoxin subunit beta-like [Conger conger]
MDAETIEIAALGRPLQPGMLYDCRRDTFIPGVSLWDQESIRKDVDVKPQPLTHVYVSTRDSLSEKTQLMEISASLTASFIAGLVTVERSGSYLNDTLSSMRQCRATIHYKKIIEFKQLTMTQLGNVIYPEVFEQKSATHVVTGVLYGGEVFMVFDQMASNEEDKQVIQGNLDSSTNKIPKVDVSSSGKVKLTDTEMKKVQKFSCTFHSNLALENNPTTYEEAVQLYKNLPELMGDGSKAVPVKVWLYPLMNLDPHAAQLVTKISVDLVTLLEVQMGQLHEAQMRADDTTQRCEAIKVTDLKEKLVKFKNILATYKDTLQNNLKKLLPAIRDGTEGKEKLEAMLKFINESSFTPDKMRKWLDDKESEVGVLENYINLLKHCDIVTPGPELISVLGDPAIDRICIFNFTSLKEEEPYLSNLFECLACEEFRKMENISVAQGRSFKEEAQPWFNDRQISAEMRRTLARFQFKVKMLKFLKHLKSKFIISYTSDPSRQGAVFRTFKQGKLQDETDFPYGNIESEDRKQV